MEIDFSQNTVTVPGNLKSLILSNFDQLKVLSPFSCARSLTSKAFPQMVLKVASVIGKVIDVDVLQAIFPADARGS